MNIRYVLVNRGAGALAPVRTLTLAAQGRHTFATRDEALDLLEKCKPSLRHVLLGREETLEVLAVECWPDHNDPKRTVFGDDYVEPCG